MKNEWCSYFENDVLVCRPGRLLLRFMIITARNYEYNTKYKKINRLPNE